MVVHDQPRACIASGALHLDVDTWHDVVRFRQPRLAADVDGDSSHFLCRNECVKIEGFGIIPARPRDRNEASQHVEVDVFELLDVHATGTLGVTAQLRQDRGTL